MLTSFAFITYTVVTFFLLWAMKPVKINWLDGLLLRAASATALAAGTVGAGGLLGDWQGAAINTASTASKTWFGGNILGLLGLIAGVIVILLWLPEKVYDKPINQVWVIVCFFIPALIGSFPGAFGNFIGEVLVFLAQLPMMLFGGVPS